jgi:CHAT domain-containing protein
MRPLLLCASILILSSFCQAAAPPGDASFFAAFALKGEPARRVAALEQERQRLAEKGEYDKALVPARAALAVRAREQGDSHWQTADARWEVKTLEKVSALKAEDQDRFRSAVRQRDEAKTLADVGQFAKADRLLRQSWRTLRTLLGDDNPETARTQHRLADVSGAQGMFEDALSTYERLLKTRRKLFGEDHPETAECHADLGATFNELGRFAEALPHLGRGLRISLRTGGEKNSLTAMIYNNTAFSYVRLERYEAAEALQRRCLAIRRELYGDGNAETLQAQGNLAGILNELGHYQEARKLLVQTLAGWRKLDLEDSLPAVLAWNNLGFSLMRLGGPNDALPCYERALAIRRRLGAERHPDTALAYSNLGALYNEMDRPEDALPMLDKARELYVELGLRKHPNATQTLSNTAYSFMMLKRFDSSIRLYEKALALTPRRRGDPTRSALYQLINLGAAYNEAGRFAEAWRVLSFSVPQAERLLPAGSREITIGQNNLARTLAARGDLKASLTWFEKSYEVCRASKGEFNVDTQTAASNVAHGMFVLKRYKEAEKWSDRTVRSFAQARLRASSSGLERAGFASHRSPFDLHVVLQARRGAGREAWRSLEQSLSAGLRDDLAIRRLFDPRQAKRHEELTGELLRLNQQLSALESLQSQEAEKRRAAILRAQDKARLALRDLQTEVSQKHGALGGEASSLEQIQKQLPEDSALVAWVEFRSEFSPAASGEENWACVVRSRGEPRWVRLRPFLSIDDKGNEIARVLTSFMNNDSDSWKDWATRAYRERIAPLRDALKADDKRPAVKRLIVLPSLLSLVVPLEPVMEARPKGAPAYTVSYAPSGTVFAMLRARKAPASEGLLALGDPSFAGGTTAELRRGSKFSALPGTRREVEAIAGMFEMPRSLLGADASEQNLDALAEKGQLQRYRYLHLATHGLANLDQPMNSFLALADRDLPDPARRVLANQTPYVGRLTAGQILSRWKLDADLVILSACQTGLGKYQHGEGFVGFAQALFLAGARALIVSRWSVDDEATSLLMIRFYENLLGKRKGLKKAMSKADALAEAKQWLRGLSAKEIEKAVESLPRGKLVPAPKSRQTAKPFAHPYYWAGFVLVGDPH